MTLDANWFSEISEPSGSAFSLQTESLLHQETTPFQSIAVYQTHHYGRLLVMDGCIMLSSRDNFIYHEMMSHPVLFSHMKPRRVAIIGGGDCGTLQQVLLHPSVVTAIQIEIDERVTRLCEHYFPELCTSNNDPRAQFLFDDGIQWMAQQAPNSLDVIIIDSTDPIGPAVGLFQEPFYRSCCDALADKGLLVQQSESPLLHQAQIQNMHEQMKRAGFMSTHMLNFPQSVYPSGWWSATIAAKQSGELNFRHDDAINKAFPTQYYNDAIHLASQALPQFLQPS